MSLAAGTRLGPYEVLTLLGAGGMGEVYKARDTRLERTVAVKILPAHTADRPDVRQRFEREARAVSALNHPHICTLHDVGREDTLDYIVMEYLEGESLADRLKRGPLPLDQALRTATEVADALDRAHRTGITHRDLKPGNIMLTKDGAKVLDFGLAKMREYGAGAAVSGGSVMATLTSPLTGEGSLVGTLQYMAPEQLEGQEADARSDIFAFGAVLFEMTAGRRAFEARTQAGLIAQIMEHRPPALSTITPLTPPALERLVEACMAKDRAERRQTMHDVLIDLKWIAAGGPRTAAAPRASRRRMWIAATAAALGMAGVAIAAAYWLRPRTDAALMRFTMPVPEKTSFGLGLALSPDGKRLAYVARAAGGLDGLWIRALDSLTPQLLPGTEGASLPFWSPDSANIAFFGGQKLKRVSASGGPPQDLCTASDGRGGSWSREGVILFAPEPMQPLQRIPASGGAPTPVTKLGPSRAEISHRWPYFLPDGRHFVFFSYSSKPQNNAVGVGSLDSLDTRILTRADSAPAYSPLGFLLFARGTALVAQAFSTGNLGLSGEPFPVVPEIAVNIESTGPTGAAQFSVSPSGALVYRAGGDVQAQLIWFDRAGKPLGRVGQAGTIAEPALSPDGKRVAMESSLNIWTLDLTRNVQSRFTFGTEEDGAAAWSPDGNRILFSSLRNGHSNLYLKAATGGSVEELLLNFKTDATPDDWSRDGRTVVFETIDPKTRFDLWMLPVDGDRKPAPYLQTEFNEGHAKISPDGRWLAYGSDETGKAEVYVQSFPVPTGGKYRVSANGGDQPQWRLDGKELFYITLDRKLMAVDVKSGAAFEAGTARELFQTHSPQVGLTLSRNHYLPDHDGKKFLVLDVAEDVSASPITVVLNWPKLANK